MTASHLPMFIMPCACGIVWYTTRSAPLPGGDVCRDVSKLEGRRIGCGRKLPAPVPVCPDTGRVLRIIASDGRDWKEAGLPGEPWEHVSVSLAEQPTKCPAWPEMAWVKDLFWAEDETVMQLHVPTTEHVNYHPGCLHLWRPEGVEIPRPPASTVGPKA